MKHILLAEDDPAILKMTKVRLQHAGYKVLAAVNGEEVLQIVDSNEGIHLILIDIKMPKLDGLQVCQRLKTNPSTQKIPIIVFTASSAQWQKLTDQCLALGISDWIKKPFDSRVLLDKVRRALGEG